MKLNRNRPLTITRSTTPRSRSLAAILDQSQELGAAARLHSALPEADAKSDLAEGTKELAASTRGDLGWQSYLNTAAPGGGQVGGAAHASPLVAEFAADGAAGSANRAGANLGGEADGVDARVAVSPYATIPTVERGLGDEALHAKVGGGLVLGKNVKGAFVDGGALGVSSAAGLVAITDDKVRLLGAAKLGEDGVTRQLARFSSACTPALDLNLAYADGHAGAGARAVLAFGRSTIFEKYVPVDELAHLMRRRDSFLRPLIEAASAIGVASGVRPPSRADLAADLGSIDAMRPGESATWQSSRLLMLGLSAGGMGLRSVAQASTQTSSVFKLARDEGGQVTLTIRPGQVKGLRLSFEARLLGELAVDAVQSAGLQRSWSFSLDYMASRHALSRALKGEMPGYILPLATLPGAQAMAWRTLCLSKAEALPFGVTCAGTEFAAVASKGASLSGIRLPDFLGGSSLGIQSDSIAAAYGQSAEGKSVFEQSHEVSKRRDLLTFGSLQETDRASFTSAVSIGPRGEKVMTPVELAVAVKCESEKASAYGRRQVAHSLRDIAVVPLSFHGVQPSRRYAIEIVRTMSADSFAGAQLMTPGDLKKLAKDKGLPTPLLTLTHSLITTALASGDERQIAHALAKITASKRIGLECLCALASSSEREVGVVNDDHDQLLTDFLKAETYALGSKTRGHAQKAAARVDKLQRRLEKALGELAGDTALHMVDEAEQDRRVAFVGLLRDEAVQLKGDIRAALDY